MEFIAGSVVGITRDRADKSKISSASIKLQGKENIREQDAVLVIGSCTMNCYVTLSILITFDSQTVLVQSERASSG